MFIKNAVETSTNSFVLFFRNVRNAVPGSFESNRKTGRSRRTVTYTSRTR